MKPSRLLPVLAGTLALAGCFGGAKAPKSLFELTPARTRTAAAESSVPTSQALVVALPTVPQELRAQRIPVRAGGQVSYLKEAQWIDAPAILFGRLIAEIAAASGRVVLQPGETAFQAGIVLTGHLDSFGVDADAREAVVTYDAALATEGNNVRTRRFEARVPLSTIEAGTVAPALNQAANQVAAEIAAWLGR